MTKIIIVVEVELDNKEGDNRRHRQQTNKGNWQQTIECMAHLLAEVRCIRLKATVVATQRIQFFQLHFADNRSFRTNSKRKKKGHPCAGYDETKPEHLVLEHLCQIFLTEWHAVLMCWLSGLGWSSTVGGSRPKGMQCPCVVSLGLEQHCWRFLAKWHAMSIVVSLDLAILRRVAIAEDLNGNDEEHQRSRSVEKPEYVCHLAVQIKKM